MSEFLLEQMGPLRRERIVKRVMERLRKALREYSIPLERLEGITHSILWEELLRELKDE